MTTLRLLCLVAAAGHLLCGVCDCLLTYLPNGRFRFSDMQDNEKLSETFRNTPLQRPLLGMLLGCLAMLLFGGGYLGLALWMRQYSPLAGTLLLIATGIILTFGVAHHVLCGVPEWMYVRLGRTEDARQIINEFFRKTSVTMYALYAAYLLFCVTQFVMVVTGKTALPRWACVLNMLPLSVLLFPLRVAGTGNWAGAIMFLGLFFLL